MFDRFWQQYPQGSILSELLQIHGDTYIVRITLKSAEQTLVSTLAADDRLEVAETNAHQRALQILSLTETPELIPLPTAALEKPAQLPIVVSEAKAPPLPLNAPPLVEAALSPEIAIEEREAAIASNPTSLLSIGPEAVLADDLESSYPLPPISEDLTLAPTPAKHRTAKAPAPVEPEAPPVEEVPLTVTDMIPLINMELKRLNWTKEQGRDYMVTLYNKRASALLSDEELFGLLQHLQAEPSAGE